MRVLFKNKYFLNTVERLVLIIIGSTALSFMLWRAPEQAQKIIDVAAGLFVGTKLK